MSLSLFKRVIRESYVKRLSRHNGTHVPLFHGSPDNDSAPVMPIGNLHHSNGVPVF